MREIWKSLGTLLYWRSSIRQTEVPGCTPLCVPGVVGSSSTWVRIEVGAQPVPYPQASPRFNPRLVESWIFVWPFSPLKFTRLSTLSRLVKRDPHKAANLGPLGREAEILPLRQPLRCRSPSWSASLRNCCGRASCTRKRRGGTKTKSSRRKSRTSDASSRESGANTTRPPGARSSSGWTRTSGAATRRSLGTTSGTWSSSWRMTWMSCAREVGHDGTSRCETSTCSR